MRTQKVNICDVIVDNVGMQETIEAIEGFIRRGKPCYITNLNVDIAVRCRKERDFARYYREGALCVADGVPILWASRFLGTPLKEKVSGSDLVPLICALANEKGYRIFFLGGRPGAASKAKAKLVKKFPRLQIVGTYSPPFGFEKNKQELEKIERLVKAAGPDILFVGLGAPKQERWIKQYHERLGVPVSMAVGVTFEFIAGMVKRAPKWMQKSGLEWSWRLLMEPRRMWKRYLLNDPQFFRMLISQKLKTMVVLFLLLFSSSAHAFTWEFAGWYGGGCYPNIAFDPKVKNRVYLTSDVAGLWRSDDLGEHWRFITKGLGSLMVAQAAIAPSNSDILYAATATGVFVSKDAGNSWTKADTAKGKLMFVRPNNYRPLAVDPQNPNHVCAGTSQGEVYCSADAGSHWLNMDQNRQYFTTAKAIGAMGFDSKGSLYVGYYPGIYRCLSQGHCERLNGPAQVTDLVFSKKDANLMYAAGQQSLWISRDGGNSWGRSSNVVQGNTYRIDLNEDGPQPFLRVIWNNDWNGGVLLSKDGGLTWSSQHKGGKLTAVVSNPFNRNVVFRTDWWGVWRSDDGGLTWTEKILGAPNTVATRVAIANGVIYASSMDNGLLASRDQGKTYTAMFPTAYDASRSGHVWNVAVLPDNTTIIGTSSPWNDPVNQVIRSQDSGKSFSLIRQGFPTARPKQNTMWGEGYPRALAVDPKNSNIIYMGIDGDDGGGLYVSRDKGLTWQPTVSQPAARRIFKGLAVDPTNSNRIVWGACGSGGGVYVSEDAGQSFQYVQSQMQWVFDVAVGPDGAMYAAGDSGGAKLYASYDHGLTWKMLKAFDSNRALSTVTVDPLDPKRIVVSTFSWDNSAPCPIYMTADAGKTWQDITANLPDGAGANAVIFGAQSKYLYIARGAGSVYRLPL